MTSVYYFTPEIMKVYAKLDLQTDFTNGQIHFRKVLTVHFPWVHKTTLVCRCLPDLPKPDSPKKSYSVSSITFLIRTFCYC